MTAREILELEREVARLGIEHRIAKERMAQAERNHWSAREACDKAYETYMDKQRRLLQIQTLHAIEESKQSGGNEQP